MVSPGINIEYAGVSNSVLTGSVNSVFISRENLVNIEINYSDLNYEITQQHKAVSVPELLGECFLFAPGFSMGIFPPFGSCFNLLTY